MSDFRVLQSYNEIRQLVYDAALGELADNDGGREPLTDYELKHAEGQARRIADHAVMHLDAAEPVA